MKADNYDYLILSKEKTNFYKEAEKYIDIGNDLVGKYYINKLYEYKNLALYGTQWIVKYA